jgi:dTDP-4-dehydrorhamnose reductase
MSDRAGQDVKKVLVTGLNGTLGPVLAEALRERGARVVGWDRTRTPPDDAPAVRARLDAADPDAVCHLALGPERWAAALAGWCDLRGRRFLFTSTAMVFDREPDGPHRLGDHRSAKDDYGRYKIRCEDAIRGASGTGIVARIGWQIGTVRGGNQMLEALHRMMERDGVIRASRRWIPACGLIDDTAAALAGLLAQATPGVYHLDGNAESALNFPTIARALARRHRTDWRIEDTEDYVHDQRLPDPRLALPDLATRLAAG